LKIRFSSEALDDLSDAIEFVAGRDPSAAARLSERLFTRLEVLARLDFEGTQMVLRRSGEVVKSWPVPPYRIYYRRRVGALEIVRIYHQAQRPIARLR
jgi:plasmid stabilization system protein ParE